MIRAMFTVALFAGTPIAADTVVAARTIPAKAVIGPGDITVNGGTIAGTVVDPDSIIGMEARVALYAGRPIRMGDVRRPAVVERNQLLTLHYENNGLIISTDGRALGRAGPGDSVRVMNLASRSTVTAVISQDGGAYVQR